MCMTRQTVPNSCDSSSYQKLISNLGEEDDPNEHCLNYHKKDESESEKCHHDRFPKVTIQQKLGDEDVKTCCKDYGYIFKDACIWPVS